MSEPYNMPDLTTIGREVKPHPEIARLRAQLETATAALWECFDIADRIDSLDHLLNDGREIDGRIIVGGTEIQQKCQDIRTAVRGALSQQPREDASEGGDG